MLSTDSYDIALAAEGIDICREMFDGDPMDSDINSKLDFSKTLAFKDFSLIKNPNHYEFSSIDATEKRRLNAKVDFFTLFDFSAKWDPIPTMLCQNHVQVISGFMGQTTSFKKRIYKNRCANYGRNKSNKRS